jgi:hypothetical protein
VKDYIKGKLRLLKDFEVIPNKRQKAYLRGLKTEVAVDNYIRTLLKMKLGEW